MKLVYEGEVPWFDKENNRWVRKEEFESIKEEKENTYDTQIKNAESQFTSNEQQIDNQPFINLDDELPF